MELTKKEKELLKIQDNRIDFYFKVENAVIDDINIFSDIYESHLYIVLSRFCNNGNVAYPSYNTLAKLCYCSKRKVIETTNKLIEKGLINKVNRTMNGVERKSNQSNLYTVNNIKQYIRLNKSIESLQIQSKDNVAPIDNLNNYNNIVNNKHQDSDHSAPNKEIYINNNNINKKRKKETLSYANDKELEKLKKLDELKNIICTSIKKSRKELDSIFPDALYKNLDLDLLIEKIKESSYLQGLNKTPFISIFTTKEGLNKILLGYYADYQDNSKIIDISKLTKKEILLTGIINIK